MSVGHLWSGDIVEATREFLTCVSMDDLPRIREEWPSTSSQRASDLLPGRPRARRGHELASLGGDEGGVGRRLASALIYGSADVSRLAAEAGWPDGTLVCAILTDVPGAARIRQDAAHEVAYFPREADVFLFHPVDEGRLATSLRSHLVDHARAVGPRPR